MSSNTKSIDKSKKFENGKIEIQVPQGLYFAGETLEGNVVLTLSQDLLSDSLSICFHGSEKSLVFNEEINDLKLQLKNSKKEVVSKQENLTCSEEGMLKIGTYTFPFKFELDHNLPSSVYIKGVRGKKLGIANVKYKITASIYDKNSEEILLTHRVIKISTIKNTVELINEISSLITIPSFNSLFGSSKAKVTLITTPDNIIRAGESKSFSLKVDVSKSCNSVRRIEVSMLQKFRINDQPDRLSLTSIIWNKVFDEKIIKGTPANQSKTFLLVIPMEKTKELYESIKRDRYILSYYIIVSLSAKKSIVEELSDLKPEFVFPLEVRKSSDMIYTQPGTRHATIGGRVSLNQQLPNLLDTQARERAMTSQRPNIMPLSSNIPMTGIKDNLQFGESIPDFESLKEELKEVDYPLLYEFK